MRGTHVAVMAFAWLASGCASIVSDNESTTYIETIPEKARCELHGQDFIRVVATPNSIHLPANAAPITIACAAEGHRNTTEPLDTEADGWILGNIIFGGLVGVVIDAARGAGQKFPDRVTVFLEPELFATAQSRDEWFDRRRKSLQAVWDERVRRAQAQCSDETTCGSGVTTIFSERDKELAQLEERRLRARVSDGGGLTAAPNA